MIDWFMISPWLFLAGLLAGKWLGASELRAKMDAAAIERRLAWRPGKP